jgi:hypothetical protein
VYSGVPAGLFGLRQRIEISHMSGLSNVKHWLAEHGYDASDEDLCAHVLALAKRTDHVLSDEEIHACCREYAAARTGVGLITRSARPGDGRADPVRPPSGPHRARAALGQERCDQVRQPYEVDRLLEEDVGAGAPASRSPIRRPN